MVRSLAPNSSSICRPNTRKKTVSTTAAAIRAAAQFPIIRSASSFFCLPIMMEALAAPPVLNR